MKYSQALTWWVTTFSHFTYPQISYRFRPGWEHAYDTQFDDMRHPQKPRRFAHSFGWRCWREILIKTRCQKPRANRHSFEHESQSDLTSWEWAKTEPRRRGLTPFVEVQKLLVSTCSPTEPRISTETIPERWDRILEKSPDFQMGSLAPSPKEPWASAKVPD